MVYILILVVFLYALYVSSRVSSLERAVKNAVVPVPVQVISAGQPLSVTSAPPVPPLIQTATPTEFNAGKTFTIVGAAALVIGLGFFFKLAIDSGWINEWGRISVGLVVGVLFMVLGQLWKEKYLAYSSAMTGVGFAIFYLSILLGNQLYHLYPDLAAALLLALTSVLAYFLAQRHKSVVVELEAIAGAYFAPLFILYSANNQPLILGYLTVLNLVIIALALKKYSNELLFVAVFLGAVNFFAWAGNFSSNDNIPLTFAYLTVSAIIFIAVAAYAFSKEYIVQRDNRLGLNFTAVVSIYGVYSIISSYYVFSGRSEQYLPLMLLINALIFLIGFIIVDRLENKKVNYSMIAFSGLFLLLATIKQFQGHAPYILSLIFLGISMVSMLAGKIFKRKELLFAGAVFLAIELFKALIFDAYPASSAMFLNVKFLTVILTTVALVLGNWFVARQSAEELENADKLMIGAAALNLWLGVIVELLNFNSSNGIQLLVSVWTIVYGVLMLGLSAIPGAKYLRRVGFVLSILAILKVFLYDSATLEIAYRIVAFITLGIILLATAFYYQRNKEKIKQFLA